MPALSGFLRRPRFGLSVLRCSDSVLLTEVRGLSGLSSLGLSVLRGPRSFRVSLRRRRFPAFSDVRARFFGSFVDRTLSHWMKVCVFLVSFVPDSVLRGRRSEVSGRFSTTSALLRSLRRPRFGFGPFLVRTPPILIGVLGLSVSHCTDSVL